MSDSPVGQVSVRFAQVAQELSGLAGARLQMSMSDEGGYELIDTTGRRLVHIPVEAFSAPEARAIAMSLLALLGVMAEGVSLSQVFGDMVVVEEVWGTDYGRAVARAAWALLKALDAREHGDSAAAPVAVHESEALAAALRAARAPGEH